MGLALYLKIRWRKRLSTKIVLSGLALLLISSTPFIPNILVKSLENRYPVVSVKNLIKNSQPVHILILGGGHTNDDLLPANDQLSNAALGRLVEGIRLQRQIPGSLLITSGYGGREGIAQAQVLLNAAVLLGVEPSEIRMQENPENTWMEATEYRRLFGDTMSLVIVTSAIHMPRAMYLFRKAGLNPMAAPTNHLFKKGKRFNYLFWIPSAGNIEKMEAVMHEYVGLLCAAIAYP